VPKTPRKIAQTPVYLPFSRVNGNLIVSGKKTQSSRKTKNRRIKKGAIVRAQIKHLADLEITDVIRKPLSEFSDRDAKAEGSRTLEEFKNVWKALHGNWNPRERVYMIQFRLRK
jgi:hypothetical protein